MIGTNGIINVKEIYGTKVVVDIVPKTSFYSDWVIRVLEYLTNHNTGNDDNGANAEMHGKYLKNLSQSNSGKKSWHVTIDDKEIRQHLPLNVNGYHCTDGVGSHSGNMNSIGIEGCMNKDGNWNKTRLNMIKFNVWCMNNLPNLVGDNWKKTIVPHKHWYNKNCPSVILAESGGFDKFVADCIKSNNIYNPPTVSINEEYVKILKKVSPEYFEKVWIPFVVKNHIDGKLNVKGLIENTFNFNLKELEKVKKDCSELQNINKIMVDKIEEAKELLVKVNNIL